MTGRIDVLPLLLHNRAYRRSNGHGPARPVCCSEATEHILASTILLATKRPAADSLLPPWLSTSQPSLTTPRVSKQSP
jgi:hypothetical protein